MTLTARGRRSAKIVVATSPAPETPQLNPFVELLYGSMPSDISLNKISVRSLVLGKYDAVHIHWPEHLLRRHGRRCRFVDALGLCSILLVARFHSTLTVWTVHNPTPHDPGNTLERLALRLFGRFINVKIWMNDHSLPEGAGRRGRQVDTVIKHGHYLPEVERAGVRSTYRRNSLISFGSLRYSSGVKRLLDAFSAVQEPCLTLHLLGEPADPHVAASIKSHLETIGDERIIWTPERMAAFALYTEVAESQLCVLPYKNLENSGALLLALSLCTPVLAPNTPTVREIQAEVGPGWIYTFDVLTPAKLEETIRRVRSEFRAGAPQFADCRDWSRIGGAHHKIYTHSRERAGSEVGNSFQD
jgi:beta-1,4-mannosyltransferase